MNLEQSLYSNILKSNYFKQLYDVKTYHEVIDEIYNHVEYLCPYIPGTNKTPSTAFCLLYKLYTMKLTEKQLNGLVTHTDSPYIRAIGFMYLRYCHPPAKLWEWFGELLDDQDMVKISPKDKEITMQTFLLGLLKEMKFSDTLLPRIPHPIMIELNKHIQEYESENGLKSSHDNRDKYSNENRQDRYGRRDDRYNDNQRDRNDYGRRDDRYNDNRSDDRYSNDRYSNDDRNIRRDDRYNDNRRDDRYNNDRYSGDKYNDKYSGKRERSPNRLSNYNTSNREQQKRVRNEDSDSEDDEPNNKSSISSTLNNNGNNQPRRVRNEDSDTDDDDEPYQNNKNKSSSTTTSSNNQPRRVRNEDSDSEDDETNNNNKSNSNNTKPIESESIQKLKSIYGSNDNSNTEQNESLGSQLLNDKVTIGGGK